MRGLVGSLLLLAGGFLYARTPARSRVLTDPLREGSDHLALGLVVVFVGLVLLTWSWWSLVRGVSGDPVGVRRVRWTTALWTLPLAVAPPLFSNDGWSYVATGYLAGHGFSPYAFTPSILPLSLSSGVDPVWRSTTSPYGPLPLLWGALFSRATADPWMLLFANRLLEYVGLVLLAAAVPILARRSGRDPARASALAIASPVVVAHGIGGLHNDLLLVGLMAMALAVTRPRHWWWGAVIAGLAAAVKLPGGVVAIGVVLISLVPAAGLARRLRRSAAVGLVAVSVLLATSLCSGFGLGWVSGLTRTADERARLAPTALLGEGIRHALLAWGPRGHDLVMQTHPVQTVKHLGLVVLVLVALWVLLRRRIPDHAAALGGAGIVALAAALLSPALHYWYFLWALPLLACLPLSRRGEGVLMSSCAVLGLTALADPSIRVAWLFPLALALLVAVPAVAWLVGDRVLGRATAAHASR